jgi:hypothetical protein
MKTIKEQQTEYVQAHTESVESYEAYAEKEEIAAAFEAGANYVLGEMEKIINHPRIFVKGDKTVEEGMIEAISKLIEQLKEK